MGKKVNSRDSKFKVASLVWKIIPSKYRKKMSKKGNRREWQEGQYKRKSKIKEKILFF